MMPEIARHRSEEELISGQTFPYASQCMKHKIHMAIKIRTAFTTVAPTTRPAEANTSAVITQQAEAARAEISPIYCMCNYINKSSNFILHKY